MSILTRRPRLRWLVPLLAAVLLVTGGAAVGAVGAVARGGLPDRSATRLLADVQTAQLTGLSGTITEKADLGLPSIPGAQGGGSSSDLTSLISGTHTLQLWYAGPQRVRLSLQGTLGESDVIRNGSDLWVWSSHDRTASHRTVPTGSDQQGPSAMSLPMTPQQAADEALKAIGPTTNVTTNPTAVVAGRSAYELVLQPKDARSLVGEVRIAIDGATHVPMRVQVFPKGAGQPALEVGFTSFDPTVPPSSSFTFSPPPGTKVTEATTPTSPGHGDVSPGGGGARPQLVGDGWTSVAVTKVPSGAMAGGAPSGDGGGDGGSSLSSVLQSLPQVQGSWGSGRLLQGTLFSAILTTDGRLAVGAVPASVLEQALSTPSGG